MGREHDLWTELNRAIRLATAHWQDSPRLSHRTPDILRVYLFACLWNRPTCWACDSSNWPRAWLSFNLPDQSTMSRRLRGRHRKRLEQFMDCVAQNLDGDAKRQLLENSQLQLRRIDGVALVVSAHSKDRQARWGRGAGQPMRGYKLHQLRSAGPMPEQFAITPLNVDERTIAARFAQRIGGAGYLLGDSLYDASTLHDRFAAASHHLLVPRRKTHRGKRLGHHYQSPHRVTTLAMLEPPSSLPGGECVRLTSTNFGPSLYATRIEIERDIGNAKSFGGGLTTHLPSWVRGIERVRVWTYGKLLIDAARRRARA